MPDCFIAVIVMIDNRTTKMNFVVFRNKIHLCYAHGIDLKRETNIYLLYFLIIIH